MALLSFIKILVLGSIGKIRYRKKEKYSFGIFPEQASLARRLAQGGNKGGGHLIHTNLCHAVGLLLSELPVGAASLGEKTRQSRSPNERSRSASPMTTAI
jgi:hypothetical protein